MSRVGATPGGRRIVSRALGLFLVCALVGILVDARVVGAAAEYLELLPAGRIDVWEERSFSGNTRYRTGGRDGAPALRAVAGGSASGLYWKREVSLSQWPLLRWRWEVDALPAPADERRKDGDDFAARVYVVAAHPVFFWKTRAVCYVWAAAADTGTAWPNPYTGNVVMVALQSGAANEPGWREERRDVAADFRRHFGEAPERIDAVAVMTDSDQTGATVSAWYEGLRFERR